MAKKGKKIILFLVEGPTDSDSLDFIHKLNKNEDIIFQSTRGDVTSKRGVNAQNCIKKINEHITAFLRDTKIKISDIIKIIHLIDMDGAYIPDKYIKEDKTLSKFIYTTNGISANSKINVIERNKRKVEVIEKLLVTPSIRKIDYKIFFMSCNLEHVLHNKLEDLTDLEKIELANKFADRFYEKEEDFLEFINDSSLLLSDNYKETWKKIKEDKNSLQRYSNLNLFFKETIFKG